MPGGRSQSIFCLEETAVRYLDDLQLMRRLWQVMRCVDRREQQRQARWRRTALVKQTLRAACNLAEALADYLERKEAQDGGIVRATGDGSGKRQVPQ